MADYHYLKYENAFQFCKSYFMSIGVSEEGSETIADVLTTSDLMGIESHGLQRMIMYHGGVKSGRIKPTAQPVIEKETPVSAVVNAGDGFGHIAGKMAMQLATDNGNELLAEIRLQYNKQRQQEITNELQDIIGGTLA